MYVALLVLMRPDIRMYALRTSAAVAPTSTPSMRCRSLPAVSIRCVRSRISLSRPSFSRALAPSRWLDRALEGTPDAPLDAPLNGLDRALKGALDAPPRCPFRWA